MSKPKPKPKRPTLKDVMDRLDRIEKRLAELRPQTIPVPVPVPCPEPRNPITNPWITWLSDGTVAVPGPHRWPCEAGPLQDERQKP